MKKDIKIDFVRIQEITEEKSFAFCLRRISRRSDFRKTEDIDGNPYRLTEFSEKAGIIRGDIIKVRMDSIPVKAKAREGRASNWNWMTMKGSARKPPFCITKHLRY